jgi:transcriptional regulator with XRE-family HTH domain
MSRAPPRKQVPLEVVIGRAIRHLRTERRLSQAALASRLGITVERVRAYEKAERPMGPRILMRLARTFDLPLSAFFRDYRRHRPLGAVASTLTTYQGLGQDRLRRTAASWSAS